VAFVSLVHLSTVKKKRRLAVWILCTVCVCKKQSSVFHLARLNCISSRGKTTPKNHKFDQMLYFWCSCNHSFRDHSQIWHEKVYPLCITVASCQLIHDLAYFFPCLYNRVFSELTTRNPLPLSRLACSCLSGYIQPSVNKLHTDGAANLLNTTTQHLNCNGQELS